MHKVGVTAKDAVRIPFSFALPRSSSPGLNRAWR
jgi:hypothetical protein